jgi:hypothetical protein
MTDEELGSLKEALSNVCETNTCAKRQHTYDWDSIHRIREYIDRLRLQFRGGHKSLNDLLQEFKSSPSEDIAYELYTLFDHQCRNDQKRILKALLSSDHLIYAYALLKEGEWGHIFRKEIQKAWLKDRYADADELVIKYADEEFLLKHLRKLSERISTYNKICMRLGDNPKFTINPKLFQNRWDYYTTLCYLGRGVTKKEILLELFGAVKEAVLDINNSYEEIVKSYLFKESDRHVSVRLVKDIDNALSAMHDAGLNEELRFFYNWESVIQKRLKESTTSYYIEDDKPVSCYNLWRMYCYLVENNFPNLTPPAERQGAILERLQPVLGKLKLEISDDPFESFETRTIKIPFEGVQQWWEIVYSED